MNNVSFDDVLLVPRFSRIKSREDCSLKTDLGNTPLHLPIIAANMDTICDVKMAKFMATQDGLGIIHRAMPVTETYEIMSDWYQDEDVQFDPLCMSVGCLRKDQHRIDTILSYCDNNPGNKVRICVDIAHGNSNNMLETLDHIRHYGYEGLVIAGNVCTPNGVERLVAAGADVVKVGIGPGSACSTRNKTGCGYPQLAAIIECAKVGPIIADGGIRTSGDAAKALAAGAKAIMIGGMLAGTDCTPGWDEDLTFSKFRGMASKEARKAQGEPTANPEGISVTVVNRPQGSTQEVIQGIIEGVQSAMSYSDASNLDEFRRNAQIIEVRPSIMLENSPHITQGNPNIHV